MNTVNRSINSNMATPLHSRHVSNTGIGSKPHSTNPAPSSSSKLPAVNEEATHRSEPQSFLSRIAAVSRESRQAAEVHQAQGLSMRDGLKQYRADRAADAFLKLFSETYGKQAMAAEAAPQGANQAEPRTAQSQGGGTLLSSVDQIGRTAQNMTLQENRAQILSYVGQQLGVDFSNMSSGQITEHLIKWALGDSSTAAVAGGAASASATAASGTAVSSTAAAASSEGAAAAGTAGAAGTAAEGAAAAGSSTANGVSASGVVGAVGAAYSAYQLIANYGNSTPESGAMQGAAVGGYIGTVISPGLGTVIGTAIGAVVGGVIGAIRTGKHKDQLARDAVRANLQNAGYIDEKYNLKLANGELYNIGLDGGHKYENQDGTNRRAYQIDSSDPRSTEAIGWMQPIGVLITGGNPKLSSDFTGYLVNAILSNDTGNGVNAVLNGQALFAQLGISPQDAIKGLNDLKQAGKISEAQFNAYANGLATLLTGTTSTGTPVLPQAEAQKQAA